MARGDSASFLGPGFRFHPTDEELLRYYLKQKVTNKPVRFDLIFVVDVYRTEPWDLPGLFSFNFHSSLFFLIGVPLRVGVRLCELVSARMRGGLHPPSTIFYGCFWRDAALEDERTMEEGKVPYPLCFVFGFGQLIGLVRGLGKKS
ncbi:unnamed protein product [Linum trigynum]|uniref:NAC domain-containing protein n=1 Tax=Linum trigynum TaxID=586398 RepID=A0AAV2F4F6_9ROSI